MTTKNFVWPAAWREQNESERKFEARYERLEFGTALPGCVGFVSKTGEVVIYGEKWRELNEAGKIGARKP